jgi:biotin-(acetyl-CoA carboxylase) ligase
MSLPTRLRDRSAPDIRLPPGFRLVTLREAGDAFAHATAHAAKEGAGTLFFVGRFDLIEFALVLEPDEPLRSARRVFYAGMAALADALAVHAPPEIPITIEWPDTFFVNYGVVGGGRLAWPQGANEDSVPDWLVFGGMIRTVVMGAGEPGLRPMSAALEEEGFGDLSAGKLVETFARHFMVTLDGWQNEEFAVVAKSYLSRLTPDKEKGVRRDIDGNGDLLVRRMGKVEVTRRPLAPALAVPAWLDLETGAPKL